MPINKRITARTKSIEIDEDDRFVDIDAIQEDESDLRDITGKTIQQLIVMPIDWTVETILAQIKRGTIDLNPKFQRRDAWNPRRKSRFIESIFMGLPVPQIVLAETSKGSFLVIDGKQRLLTLKQFGGVSESPSVHEGELELTGLEYRRDLNGKTLSALERDMYLGKSVNEFRNQTIRTVVVKNWKSESILFLLFLRLNQNSVSLSPQELRRALHPGRFIDAVNDYSEKSRGLEKILGTVPDFRMRDVEIIIRFFAFKKFSADYRGNMKSFLDNTTQILNKSWKSKRIAIESQFVEFEDAIALSYEIFGKYAFSKPKGDGYEGRINRAVMDIMLYYFSDKRLAKGAKEKKVQVSAAFRELCENDKEFVQAIERTTKSLGATRTRFNKWAKALSDVLKVPVSPPKFGSGS